MSGESGVAALLRLMAWMSPAFPVGGFSYSGGLEKAVEDGRVRDAAELSGWVETLLHHGSLWNDAVFLADAWRCSQDAAALGETADLGRALAGSAERYRETVLLGTPSFPPPAPGRTRFWSCCRKRLPIPSP